MIGNFGQRRQRGPGLLALDLRTARIDQIELAGKALLAQKALRPPGCLVGVIGGSDDGDDAWCEQQPGEFRAFCGNYFHGLTRENLIRHSL